MSRLKCGNLLETSWKLLAESHYLDISIIIIGASVLSYLSVIGRLPVVLAYLLCGVIVGPWGFKFIHEIEFINQVSEIGIALLLFLAGVELHPRKLKEIFTRVSVVTGVTCCITVSSMYFIISWMGFSSLSSWMIAISLMFSSTILAIKLIPTTTLHHHHMGAYCIAILIMQDIIAIICLMVFDTSSVTSVWSFFLVPVKGVFLIAFAFAFEQYALRPIMQRCESVAETLYLFPMAWCLGLSLISGELGFSYELGAFVSGLALTRSPISQFLMERLKLLRDFFLLFFFFALGAQMDLEVLPKIFVHALGLCLALMFIKIYGFSFMIRLTGENKSFATQAGIRLGQASEFSMIIAMLMMKGEWISKNENLLIQLTTILTFVFSSFLVTNFYRTPWTTPAAKQA